MGHFHTAFINSWSRRAGTEAAPRKIPIIQRAIVRGGAPLPRGGGGGGGGWQPPHCSARLAAIQAQPAHGPQLGCRWEVLEPRLPRLIAPAVMKADKGRTQAGAPSRAVAL